MAGSASRHAAPRHIMAPTATEAIAVAETCIESSERLLALDQLGIF